MGRVGSALRSTDQQEVRSRCSRAGTDLGLGPTATPAVQRGHTEVWHPAPGASPAGREDSPSIPTRQTTATTAPTQPTNHPASGETNLLFPEQQNKPIQTVWKLQNMKVLFETWTLIPQGISLLHPPFLYFSSDFQMLYEKDEKNLKSSILDWELLSFSLPQDIFDFNKLHEKSIWDFLILSLSWPITVASFNTLWGQQCNKWVFRGSLRTWSSDAAANRQNSGCCSRWEVWGFWCGGAFLKVI